MNESINKCQELLKEALNDILITEKLLEELDQKVKTTVYEELDPGEMVKGN